MRFVDSHLHLGGEADGALSTGAATGTLLVTCGTGRQTSEQSLGLARRFPDRVKAFVGVHPSEALGPEGLGWLKDALDEAAGLGEVGLDPAYPSAGQGDVQRQVFLEQLELARRLGKPVQVHSRGAEKAVIETLGAFRLKATLMHWLESEEALPGALAKGYFVSFGPAILYSKKLQRMARSAPPGQVLTETDSPVPYGPLKGANGPSLIPSVVFKLAELWGMKFEDARAGVVAASMSFLGLTEKG